MTQLSVAVVQSIPRPGDIEGSIQDHVRLASNAIARGAQVVVFPELSLTGYDRRLTRNYAIAPSDPRLESLRALASRSHGLLIAGAPLVSTRGLCIGAVCFMPDGSVASHTKQYLHAGEEIAFVPGDGGDPLVLAGARVGIAICADITHAEHARAAAARKVSIYAASCFITPQGFGMDSDLLEGYARQHGMAVLMANYGAPSGGWASAGRSAIWSNTGELLAQGPIKGEAVMLASV